MPKLTHPLTGQVIEVPADTADEWTAAGWLPEPTDTTQDATAPAIERKKVTP